MPGVMGSSRSEGHRSWQRTDFKSRAGVLEIGADYPLDHASHGCSRVLYKMRIHGRQAAVAVRIWSPCFSRKKIGEKLGLVLMSEARVR